MRRILIVMLLALLPTLAAVPGTWQVTSTHAAAAAAKRCTKKVKIVHGKRTVVKKCPRTPVRKVAPATPTRTPTRTPRPTRTPTRTPTPTPTSTATPTSTPTNTPTDTPTATSTPHPPAIVTMPVEVQVAEGFRVHFMVCGLPNGASASFLPNPVTSVASDIPGRGPAAITALAVSVPFGTEPITYALNVIATYQTPTGVPVALPAGGAYTDPRVLILQVNRDGSASLTAPPNPIIATSSNCSASDPSFLPAPTPTPSSSNVVVTASVSNRFPAANQQVTVTGKLTVFGKPVYGALMTTHWYFPFSVLTCTGVTDVNGNASCSMLNSHVLPNYPVQVQVSFTVSGISYFGYTVFYM